MGREKTGSEEHPTDGPLADNVAKDLPECTLYWFPFSLYSIMIMTDMHRREHVSEVYLTINPKGQVPCLSFRDNRPPLTDSLPISWWVAERCPKLLGGRHEPEVRRLVADIHGFHAFALSVTDQEREEISSSSVDHFSTAADEALEREISPEYRKALEFKRDYYRQTYFASFQPDRVAETERKARKVLQEICDQYQAHGKEGSYIFGDEVGPTILDAHTVPLIARLFDMDRTKLVPDILQGYARIVMAGPLYNSVTHGRPTMWNRSLGRPHEMDPL